MKHPRFNPQILFPVSEQAGHYQTLAPIKKLNPKESTKPKQVQLKANAFKGWKVHHQAANSRPGDRNLRSSAVSSDNGK